MKQIGAVGILTIIISGLVSFLFNTATSSQIEIAGLESDMQTLSSLPSRVNKNSEEISSLKTSDIYINQKLDAMHNDLREVLSRLK